MTNNFRLNRMADNIESVLEFHNIQGHISGGAIGVDIVIFNLITSMPISRTHKILALKTKITTAIGATKIEMYREGEIIKIAVMT